MSPAPTPDIFSFSVSDMVMFGDAEGTMQACLAQSAALLTMIQTIIEEDKFAQLSTTTQADALLGVQSLVALARFSADQFIMSQGPAA